MKRLYLSFGALAVIALILLWSTFSFLAVYNAASNYLEQASQQLALQETPSAESLHACIQLIEDKEKTLAVYLRKEVIANLLETLACAESYAKNREYPDALAEIEKARMHLYTQKSLFFRML